MDTVSFVVALIPAQSLIIVALGAIIARLWYVLRAERRENDRLRLVAQSRPRSPHEPYDTGLAPLPLQSAEAGAPGAG